ncbi:hypothetical protein F8E02_09890 [Methanoculleus sp. Wushi-C6]|uniref:Glycerophosphoryl diester phosphodiesterase membrane domain-containing protein n=1 Tax=Methanoculleus caldifontis TaxID=2651577 RepID=A0ABU3X2P2_9EURY|nr:hypothetical protein [Methanoculleus sp. Wushi-C6]MDV2482304.1 hypothetical protein [Methanoculleus sp. Wushi-C6]
MAEEIYAFSRLEETFSRTKSLLWPPNRGIWLRLAVIALFVGGGASFPNFSQYNFGGGDLPPGMDGSFSGIMPLIAAFVIVVLGLALLWMLVGAAMQFVFVDMLSTGEIRIRRFFGERFGKGVRLFLFQFVFMLALIIGVAALAFALFGLAGAGSRFGVSALVLLLIPALLIVALLVGVVFLLTIDFVVPIMIREDCGVIEGWRRLIGVMSGNLWQTAAYVVVKFVLGLIAALVQAVLVILAMLVVAIPFVLVGIVLLAVLQAANYALLLLLLIPYLIIVIPVGLLIAVPFVTFFRYYGLLVLAGLAPEYRLLPE